MAKVIEHNPADFIVPLSIGGLEGRMLHIPAGALSTDAAESTPNQREILFIYGHHSSLERWWGVAEVLSQYGAVTMPDLPGFGGMDSFYKIGQKPTIDNLADYLAAFIKWRYKRQKHVTIAGMSYGFVVVTRMLQRFPELARKVDLLVSVVGFASHSDFTFAPSRYWSYRLTSRLFSHAVPAWVFRRIALNKYMLRLVYGRTHNAKTKFAAAKSRDEFNRLMAIETVLWQSNDVRTYMFTTHEFLMFDNTDRQIKLPVWHVSTVNDHFFDHTVIEQHLRVIFSDFHGAVADLPNHAPSVIANAAMAAPLFPPELRAALTADSES